MSGGFLFWTFSIGYNVLWTFRWSTEKDSRVPTLGWVYYVFNGHPVRRERSLISDYFKPHSIKLSSGVSYWCAVVVDGRSLR